jgi:3-phenylpropionate/trans-cinnamate dioxygenase ferredoxin reductase subunit
MPDSKYLIIGGGMTADAAVEGIRQKDASGSITVIGAEKHRPYNRPPLSKGLWKGDAVDSIWRNAAQTSAELILGRRVRQIDSKAKQVTDDQGVVHGFEKLLLATGGEVKRLPFGGEDIVYFRTRDDYERLRGLADRGKSFAVIGAGFIGWEIAAALAMNGREVAMLFPEPSIGSRLFPQSLAQFLNDFYREKGVNLMAGDTAIALEKRGSRLMVKTRGGRSLEVDGVAAGIGISPNLELAKNGGLQTNGGIVVNELLQTSDPAIYAAGDVAEFFNPALGKRIRVEHEDAANTMGNAAGANMAGDTAPYRHLPFFYSDLFDLGFEAVGEIDSRLEIFEDWKTPFREGVVYYLDKGRVRGILLWNTWGQVGHARELIAQKGPFQPNDLKGRLPAG